MPKQARETPEFIEEIEREAPDTQDPPPQLLRTFVCCGDAVEVMEDEEASQQVETLKATLASVSSQIQVS